MEWHKAQDTFIAVLDDGTERLVTKVETLAGNHELVKRDLKGSGTLFRPMDTGEDKAPAKSEPAKAEEKAPVKASPKTAGKAS